LDFINVGDCACWHGLRMFFDYLSIKILAVNFREISNNFCSDFFELDKILKITKKISPKITARDFAQNS
jgi:hypothetical protein